MENNNAYWWIKLQEDFFNSKEMKKLRRIAGGAVYTIIYLKMQLLSLKTGGKLFFDGIEDTFADEIALTIDEDPENVAATLLFLEKAGLASRVTETEILLPEVEKNTGSETKWASKKRNYRKAIREKKLAEIEAKEDNVRAASSACPTELEIEIESELETEREKNAHTLAHAREEDLQAFGTYKNVFLTDPEVEQLQQELPGLWEDYAERLSSYKKQTGKTYASDFATIRRWVKEDAEIVAKTAEALKPNAFNSYDGRREYTSEEMNELELKMRKRRAGAESEGDE